MMEAAMAVWGGVWSRLHVRTPSFSRAVWGVMALWCDGSCASAMGAVMAW